MPDLLLGLAVGAGLIVALNLALIRFTRTSAKLAAAVTALITVGLYVPYSIIRWPGATSSPCTWRFTCWLHWRAECS